MQTCFYKIEKEDGGFSPCLLNEGHNGSHKHFSICANPGCICSGFENKLMKLGLIKEWIRLKREVKEGQSRMFELREIVEKEFEEEF